MYGSKLSIYETANLLSGLFNLQFQERESSFSGVYLTTDFTVQENVKVKENQDPEDGEAVEDDYREWPTLVYFNFTNKSKIIFDKLKGNYPEEFTLIESK